MCVKQSCIFYSKKTRGKKKCGDMNDAILNGIGKFTYKQILPLRNGRPS